MKQFKCKLCDEPVLIKSEWIKANVARTVSCDNCGYETFLNIPSLIKDLNKRTSKKKASTEIFLNSINLNEENNFFIKILETPSGYKSTTLLEHKNYIIGRSKTIDDKYSEYNAEILIIDDPYVSRNHCLIKVLKRSNKTIISILDLQSSNGVKINKSEKLSAIDEVILKDGDEIYFGDSVLKLISKIA